MVYGLVQIQARPEPLVLDVIGSGEDLEAIQEYAAEKKLNWRWLGGKDHADPSMHDYQVNCCQVYTHDGCSVAQHVGCALLFGMPAWGRCQTDGRCVNSVQVSSQCKCQASAYFTCQAWRGSNPALSNILLTNAWRVGCTAVLCPPPLTRSSSTRARRMLWPPPLQKRSPWENG
jgi:hypothetical protein